jgi:hypothetical protein
MWTKISCIVRKIAIGLLLQVYCGLADAANSVLSLDIGIEMSEQAARIQLAGFGQPKMLGNRSCRNTDSTPFGDGKGGWATITIPSTVFGEENNAYIIELTVLRESTNQNL